MGKKSNKELTKEIKEKSNKTFKEFKEFICWKKKPKNRMLEK